MSESFKEISVLSINDGTESIRAKIVRVVHKRSSLIDPVFNSLCNVQNVMWFDLILNSSNDQFLLLTLFLLPQPGFSSSSSSDFFFLNFPCISPDSILWSYTKLFYCLFVCLFSCLPFKYLKSVIKVFFYSG